MDGVIYLCLLATTTSTTVLVAKISQFEEIETLQIRKNTSINVQIEEREQNWCLESSERNNDVVH